VLVVEQRVRDALEVADRAYVISNGQIAITGSASEMAGRIEEIESTYLASSELVRQAG
jgi:branched-chain amino acid transport system ATP-binding protein